MIQAIVSYERVKLKNNFIISVRVHIFSFLKFIEKERIREGQNTVSESRNKFGL